MPSCQDSDKVFTIVGNRKTITVKTVTDVLRVVGNNNKIEVAHNYGTIEVIGNRCRLNIDENNGGVAMIGNHGAISIARPARGGGGGGGVQSTGLGCKVIIKGSLKNHPGFASSKIDGLDWQLFDVKGLETLLT